jgi:hypothetical protein
VSFRKLTGGRQVDWRNIAITLIDPTISPAHPPGCMISAHPAELEAGNDIGSRCRAQISFSLSLRRKDRYK